MGGGIVWAFWAKAEDKADSPGPGNDEVALLLGKSFVALSIFILELDGVCSLAGVWEELGTGEDSLAVDTFRVRG